MRPNFENLRLIFLNWSQKWDFTFFLISSPAYYDRGAPTEVIADASPVGLGAVLDQEVDGERRTVCYASRVLVTLNVGTLKLKRKYLRLFGPARDLICTCMVYPSLT